MKPRTTSLALACALIAASPLAADIHPNTQPGFSGSTFQSGGVDHVNVFNGNLVLALSIGGSYPVNGGLSYGLGLAYNSKPWEFQLDATGLTKAIPNRRSNAGMGWMLSLGKLYAPTDLAKNDTGKWLYIGSDGAERIFFSTLHDGETVTSNVFYTRDGSYLRLNAGTREVELPNGQIHKFGSDGEITQIRDRFNNQVNVTYPSSLLMRITDGHGRIQDVNFQADGLFGKRVSSVVLRAFAGTTATYTFGYATAPLMPQPCPDNSTETNPIDVTLLTSVTLPDGSSYSMPTSSYHLDAAAGCRLPGLIKGMTLPTLGRVEWTYQDYKFPTEGGTGPKYREIVAGVATRKLVDASGVAQGTWTYATLLESGTAPKELKNTVTNPLGHKTEHFFSVAVADSGAWTIAEYGLPLSHYFGDGLGRHLSTKTYNAASTLLRTGYVQYEWDASGGPDIASASKANQRPKSTRTVFHDDAGRYADTTFSDFDGLGHYRKVTTDGNIGSADVLASVTNYNPARGTYPGSFTMLPTTSAWVLGTFDAQWVEEGGVAKERRDFCFEAANGFLTRVRTRKVASGTGAGDLLTVFTRNTPGNLIREQSYGGDLQGLGSNAAVCGLALPASDVYRVDHTYQNGSLRISQPYYAGGTALTHKTLDLDIDLNTGLPATSRDVSLIATGFEYDGLGRLTWVKPAAGHGAWTQNAYTRATSATARASVVTRQRAGSKTATVLAESMSVYDHFGRLFEEQQKSATGTWPKRQILYNALGQTVSVSEMGNATKKTQYLGYDPFGRPTTIRPPDGSAHDVSLSYLGVRQVQRTVRVASTLVSGVVTENPFVTTELYDRQGRLWKVTEPSGTSNGQTTTTYAYDAGGRLKSAATGVQTRLFNYDQRGFLLNERHPEKGTSSGNGYVYYSNFDALGNVGRKIDGPYDLLYTYDRAGRLTLVKESAGTGGRTLKTFGYATANLTGNYRMGKLETANRYNYVSIGTSPYTVQVQETYVYGGKGGRVSKRDTNHWANGTAGAGFSASWVYNDLGAVATTTYPRCIVGGCLNLDPARTVSSTYTNGWLTALGGSASYASSITYHTNGTTNVTTYGNGVTLTQGIDPNAMQRPASYLTGGAINASGTAFNWNSGAYAYDGAGNVKQIGSATNNYFLYDGVSRVRTAGVWDGRLLTAGTQRTQGFTFDVYGNLTAINAVGGGAPGRTISVNANTNRLSSPTNVYDNAGNLTSWNSGASTYKYGPFNELWSMKNGAEDWVYLYTADDERFWSYKVGGGSSRWTLRDLDNKTLREYEAAGGWKVVRDYVYGGGRLLAAHTDQASPAHLLYYHSDHLGTPRLITRSDKVVTAYHAYYPFGEEATAFNQDTERAKFTGHERDLGNLTSAADDLDYMHARFFNPQVGRMLSTDLIYPAPGLPQGWNRYSYALNSPVTLTDPTGLWPMFGLKQFAPTGMTIYEIGLAAGITVIGKSVKLSYISSNPTGAVSIRNPTGSIWGTIGFATREDGPKREKKGPEVAKPEVSNCAGFADHFGHRFRVTNSVIWTTAGGGAARGGATMAVSSHTARALGTASPLQWAASGFGSTTMTSGASVATLSRTASAAIVGSSALINAVLVTGALEIGIAAGSALGAAGDLLVDDCR